MKRCKCGNECADNAKSCPRCGYRFTSSFAKLVIVVVLICVVYFLFKHVSTSLESATGSSPSTEGRKEIVLRDVKLDYRWYKSGFGSVMVADLTVTNPTAIRFKDFEVTCTHFAPSGTKIDSNTRTVYQSRRAELEKGR